ncbi:hypothetical protein JB92DRAFT_2836334 [Gautieria morchelliformis]|nr:hypothetical protein JB92DRAFT_2836334 [Gautieria morchelliformis]
MLYHQRELLEQAEGTIDEDDSDYEKDSILPLVVLLLYPLWGVQILIKMNYSSACTGSMLRTLRELTITVLRQSIGYMFGWLHNSFQAARQSVHNAIVAKFGNPHLSQDFSAETLEHNEAGRESQPSPGEAGSAGRELDEFPWATGCPGDVEMAVPIISSEKLASPSDTG